MKWIVVFIVLWWLTASKVGATSLELSDVPAEISAEESFEVTVNFVTSSKNSTYYLAGVFFKTKGSNLFGLTEVGGEFIPISASPSSFFPITTSADGTWSGKLKVKADINDAGFDGQGNYFLKINRYTGKSETAAESSNAVELALLYEPPATPTPISIPTPTLLPTPENTPIPTSTIKPPATISPSATLKQTTKPVATTAATATPTPQNTPVTSSVLNTAMDEEETVLNSTLAAILGETTTTAETTAADKEMTEKNFQNNKIAPGMILIGSILVAGGIIPLSLRLFPR